MKKTEKQKFEYGCVAPACQLHHSRIPSMRGHANGKIMNNFVFQEVVITNVFIHVTLCRLQIKGVTWHLSAQGMLEQLVNSIIEGPLHNSFRTICD